MASTNSTTFPRKLAILAGFVGVFQSTACMLITLQIIVFYHQNSHNQIDNESPTKNYVESVSLNVTKILLLADFGERNIKNEFLSYRIFVFQQFSLFYFFLSLLWFVASIWMIIDVRKTSSRLFKLALTCGCLSILISCMDISMMGILIADYAKCVKFSLNPNTTMSELKSRDICANIFIPAFVVSAKGFLLLTINISGGIYLIYVGKRHLKLYKEYVPN